MRPEPNPNLLAALVALSVIAACTQVPPTNAAADAALVGKTARINSDATPARYINGMWCTISGDDIFFERGSRCQMDGIFVADCLDTAVMIDLENGYVIPALGDAHNHNVDGPWTADRAKTYMSNGVFYMRNLNSVVSIDK